MEPVKEKSGNRLKLTVFLLAAILFIAAVFRFSAEPEAAAPKIGFVILGDIHAPGNVPPLYASWRKTAAV